MCLCASQKQQHTEAATFSYFVFCMHQRAYRFLSPDQIQRMIYGVVAEHTQMQNGCHGPVHADAFRLSSPAQELYAVKITFRTSYL